MTSNPGAGAVPAPIVSEETMMKYNYAAHDAWMVETAKSLTDEECDKLIILWRAALVAANAPTGRVDHLAAIRARGRALDNGARIALWENMVKAPGGDPFQYMEYLRDRVLNRNTDWSRP
jgi:hypothetical protein